MLVVLAFWGRKWPCLWRGKVTDKPAAVFLDRKCWTLSWCYFLSSRFLCERKQKPHKPRGMSWLATLCEIQWNHKDAGPDLECNCCTELWGERKNKKFCKAELLIHLQLGSQQILVPASGCQPAQSAHDFQHKLTSFPRCTRPILFLCALKRANAITRLFLISLWNW